MLRIKWIDPQTKKEKMVEIPNDFTLELQSGNVINIEESAENKILISNVTNQIANNRGFVIMTYSYDKFELEPEGE